MTPILTGDAVFDASFDDDFLYASNLGLVQNIDGVARIANPIYQEIIPRVLSFHVQMGIALERSWYMAPDGSLNMARLLTGFAEFWRENGEVLLRGMPYHEAAPHLILIAYLQRIINSGGRIEREFAVGTRQVSIGQRGGQRAGGGQKARAQRPKATVATEVRACALSIERPQHVGAEFPEDLPVSVVRARSTAVDDKGKPLLHWVVLTSEPVELFEDACQALEIYSSRWLIEELFRAWKTGCRLESRPLQSAATVKRMMAILLPMAVAMRALRVLGNQESRQPTPLCDAVLEADQWRCLWRLTEPKKRLPAKPPPCRWAYHALGQLGGFSDSQRTGTIGWVTPWNGWLQLQHTVSGYRIAQST